MRAVGSGSTQSAGDRSKGPKGSWVTAGGDGTSWSQPLQERSGAEVCKLTGKVGGVDWEGQDPRAEDWNPHSLGGLPACPLLLSCLTTKPERQKSPWEAS